MQSIDLATVKHQNLSNKFCGLKILEKRIFKWQDMIRVDYQDNIPRNNSILEARRKRLDKLAEVEERKYQISLQPQEHPAAKTIRWLHYTYGAYELIRCLLN